MPRSFIALLTFCLATALNACSTAETPALPNADITITATGCTTNAFLLPAEREPLITIENQAAERMVFTLPTMNRWVALGQNERTAFELPRYIMGRFDFFCLPETAHTEAADGNPFLCVMEPADLLPVARSSGLFEIAQHNRIQEVIQRSPVPTQ